MFVQLETYLNSLLRSLCGETLVRLLDEELQANGASLSLEMDQGEENVHVSLPAYGKAMITLSLEQ